jgi:hypothetical protein
MNIKIGEIYFGEVNLVVWCETDIDVMFFNLQGVVINAIRDTEGVFFVIQKKKWME